MKPEVGKKYVVHSAYGEEWTCKYVGGSFAVLENSNGVERVPPLITFDRYYSELPRHSTMHVILVDTRNDIDGEREAILFSYTEREFQKVMSNRNKLIGKIIAYKKIDIVEGEGLEDLPK